MLYFLHLIKTVFPLKASSAMQPWFLLSDVTKKMSGKAFYNS